MGVCSKHFHNITESSLFKTLSSINYHLNVNVILNISWPFQMAMLSVLGSSE